jgi:hypothetical protein
MRLCAKLLRFGRLVSRTNVKMSLPLAMKAPDLMRLHVMNDQAC